MNQKKTAIPADIEKKMKMWRSGFAALPTDYIKFQSLLAEKAIPSIHNKGYKIHNKEMVTDGWMDGMRVMQLVVENRRNRELLKLIWNDGNQEFFVKSQTGGAYPLNLHPLR